MNYCQTVLVHAVLLAIYSSGGQCSAELVIPQIGGGQTGLVNAPMKHADISFDGRAINASVDGSVDTPTLRPLDDAFTFDTELPWGVLNDKAYNFQYGWNPGGFISLPDAAWIWVEQLEASSELEVYQRPPSLPSYEKIFEANGSIWKWPGSMTHNVYAVSKPLQNEFEATYRVYIGDEDTGEELVDTEDSPLYSSDTFTFRFEIELIGDFDNSGFLDAADIDLLSAAVRSDAYTPEFDLTQDDLLSNLDRRFWIEKLVGALPGDTDLNGKVDFVDFLSLSSAFGTDSGWADGDFDGDGKTEFPDFLILSAAFGQSTASIATVPEPTASLLLLVGAFVAMRNRLLTKT